MAARRPLRAVGPGEQRSVPKSVTEAAASGSTRELLVAMRARVAVAVEEPTTPARDLAALTKRLADLVLQIDAIDARDRLEGESEAAGVEDGEFDSSAV